MLGALLGVGGVKRLSITIVAGATVGVADLLPVEELALGVLYVLLAGILVWLPVADLPRRRRRAPTRWSRRRTGSRPTSGGITFVSTLVFGFLLTSDALVRLL